MNTITFEIPGLPISINKVYTPRYDINTGRNEYKKSQEWYVWLRANQKYVPPCPWIKPDDCLAQLVLEFYSNRWICKNGNLRDADMQNMEKPIIDMIFDRWGKKDSYIVQKQTFKIVADDDRVVVTLTEVPAEDWKRK